MTTPYTTGTVTLTNNSTAVTGTGTGWQTALISGGVLYPAAAGNPLPIASVTDNTHLTAAIPWRGTTGTYSYAIVRDTDYGGQQVDNANALMEILADLKSAPVAALSALTGAANRIPMFSSANVMTLLDRNTLADLSDLTNLVTGPATATADSVPLYSGTTGKILKNATVLQALAALGPVFGGGAPVPSAAGVGLSDGDFNTIVVPGVYTIAGTWSNGPVGAGASTYNALLEVIKRTFNNGYLQRVHYSSSTYVRWTSTSGGLSGWSAWERDWSNRFIRSPTTIPDYVTFPNGLIVQWGSSASPGNDFTITFPIAFTAADYSLHVTPYGDTLAGNAGSSVAYAADRNGVGAFNVRPRFINNGGVVGLATQSLFWWAIGH